MWYLDSTCGLVVQTIMWLAIATAWLSVITTSDTINNMKRPLVAQSLYNSQAATQGIQGEQTSSKNQQVFMIW